MLACRSGQECDDRSDWNSTGAGIDAKFQCGSDFAYTYFLSFYMLCAFLVSNIYTSFVMCNFRVLVFLDH